LLSANSGKTATMKVLCGSIACLHNKRPP